MYSSREICRIGLTTPRGLHFWEEIGLLGKVQRLNGGTHRRYTPEQFDRIYVIAAAKLAGWKLNEISKMFENWNPKNIATIISQLEKQTKLTEKLIRYIERPLRINMEYDL